MNNEKKHIDSFLNEAFAGFEPAVPPSVWAGVEQGLNKKKRRIFLWWSIAASILLIGTASLVYLFSNNKSQVQTLENKNSQNAKEVVKKEVPQQKLNSDISLPSDNNNIPTITNNSTYNSEKVKSNHHNSIPKNNTIVVLPVNPEKINPNNKININPIQEEQVTLISKSAFVSLGALSFDKNNSIALNKSTPSKTLKYESKWQVGAFVSTGLGFRALGINSAYSNYVHKNYLQIRKDGETGRMSNNFGLTISKKLNSTFSIESGITFTQSGFSQNYDYKIKEVALEDQTKPMIQGVFPIKGYFTLLNPKAVSLKSSSQFMYLGLPLMLKTNLYNNKSNQIQLIAGPSINLLIQQSGQTINLNNLELSNSQKAYSYNTMTINGRLALRYSKALSPFFNLAIEAGYTRFLQNQFKGKAVLNEKPYQSGVNAMLTYNIYKSVIHNKD